MGKCAYKWVRRFLCLANILFWIVGCSLVSFGVWLHISGPWNEQRVLPAEHALAADKALIVAGLFTIIGSLLGWLGAVCTNRCILQSYLVSVLLLMALEVLLGAVALMQRHTLSTQISAELRYSLLNAYEPNAKPKGSLALAWNQLQKLMHCCGHTNYEDWYGNRGWINEQLMPGSCCVQPEEGLIQYPLGTKPVSWKNADISAEFVKPSNNLNDSLTNQNLFSNIHNRTNTSNVNYKSSQFTVCWKVHDQGCANKLRDVLFDRMHLIASTVIIFAIFQFLGFLAALYLLCYMRFKFDYRLQNDTRKSSYNRVRTFD